MSAPDDGPEPVARVEVSTEAAVQRAVQVGVLVDKAAREEKVALVARGVEMVMVAVAGASTVPSQCVRLSHLKTIV